MNAIIKSFVLYAMKFIENDPILLQRLREMISPESGKVSIVSRGISASSISVEELSGDSIIVVPEGMGERGVKELSDFLDGLNDGGKRIVIGSNSLAVVRV